ncbi:tRNA epoxyqueuosine(34) reductase QueG [Afifella marina]|uniref:tRNA epoxyqueuosine(34) reductase QueG n=1 Tax=Afifella marina TaxID=1080 RepID=UPI000B84F822|nr:tRNA epoxyqueuosine(34) reductase QueG [Afifella marina]MBK1624963.1 tRNA epoxyqueuosine(34) reductase QueG [Afifella marina DSM 2698]MBK1628667.1 tRNA epoxyqueuosine(34) reductase QueG [Afifella marina]MBK5916497.1 tRNA epoxyqueuosine(34) reductase QueG [Afifella marina]RAI17722.1 tRNA epoxyqueuosine(34) reductase QueG [Afifella marina DSM 2698]
MKAFLAEISREEGFITLGVTPPEGLGEAGKRLGVWIDAGRHGSMEWMPETAERRSDPRRIFRDVRSVVMLGMNYGPEGDPLATLAERQKATISVYARNRDYHDLIKGAMKRIGSRFAAEARRRDLPDEIKVFVDTAPVMEKPLAAAAGIGWQGKHTNLVSREHGSWLFLGAIFTAAELPADQAETDHCGSCRRCLDACPTNAFPAPYQLDARRCISYLTIEDKGLIPREFRKDLGNRIYGCDDCLAACPWNKFAETASEAKLKARADLQAPSLKDLVCLDDAAFRQHFSGSPIKRIGRAKFVSNVLIAIGNSGDPGLASQARARLDDDSPLVRGAAIWALARLAPETAERARAELLPQEEDAAVRGEWNLLGED